MTTIHPIYPVGRYVRVDSAIALTGCEARAIRTMIAEERWLEGEAFIRDSEGRIFVDWQVCYGLLETATEKPTKGRANGRQGAAEAAPLLLHKGTAQPHDRVSDLGEAPDSVRDLNLSLSEIARRVELFMKLADIGPNTPIQDRIYLEQDIANDPLFVQKLGESGPSFLKWYVSETFELYDEGDAEWAQARKVLTNGEKMWGKAAGLGHFKQAKIKLVSGTPRRPAPN